MVVELAVDEVSEFTTAVAGLEIEWVRTDEGFGPAKMAASGDDRAAVSAGGLDFSTVLHTQIPHDRVSVQLVTHAPDGMRWCGSEAHDMDVRVYRPGTAVFGKVPAGSRAITLVAAASAVDEIGGHLGLPGAVFPNGSDAIAATPAVRALAADLLEIASSPALLEEPSGSTRLVESTARALGSVSSEPTPATSRGYDSREIVARCLDYVEANSVHQPTASELCRVGHASESRLRRAFVEMLGLPPNQYFQIRVLSRLRDDLLAAGPNETNVTDAATSLGLTQLGRTAGRYRSLFGETPSETLRRTGSRRF